MVKLTEITLSKKEATQSFCFYSKLLVPSFLKNTKYYSTIRFIGGNNDIINISVESSQSSNIIVDEENREYIVEYMNTTYKEAEFCIKGELINKCKGE